MIMKKRGEPTSGIFWPGGKVKNGLKKEDYYPITEEKQPREEIRSVERKKRKDKKSSHRKRKDRPP